MGIKLPHIKLPPPLIDPVRHPWMAKFANKGTLTVARYVVPAVAIPVASLLDRDNDSPWIANLAVSAAAGAAIGGAAGLFFPALEHQKLYRWDAIRSGTMAGLFGAPAVSLAMMGAAKWLVNDIMPFSHADEQGRSPLEQLCDGFGVERGHDAPSPSTAPTSSTTTSTTPSTTTP